MKRHVVTGAESLIRKDTKVISRSGPDYAPYMVQVENVLWTASSNDNLQPSEMVIILAVESNRLVIKHKKNG